ncbi:hypothetical protein [Escherichia coli]|nr:hypothetical protein [Escherichia coli]
MKRNDKILHYEGLNRQ